MKLRVALLALSITGMAWLVFLLLKPDNDGLAAVPPPRPPQVFPDPEPVSPPPPETEEQRAVRLQHLEPDLRELVIRIEDSMQQWEKQHPGPGDDGDEEWGEVLLGEFDKLETEQLEALMEAVMLRKAWGYSGDYHFWIYEAWGTREPAKTRDWMLWAAKATGMLDGPGIDSDKYTRERFQADFEAVRLGHARRDPLAAWRQLEEDLDNPRMEYATSKLSAEDVFQFYAKQDPQGAWHEIDSRPDLAFYLVPGFAMGAPPGQDWEARLEDYASLCRGANGPEARADRAVKSLVARWLTEDPDAALAWVDFRFGFEDFLSAGHMDFLSRRPPPELPGLEAPSQDLLVELEMIRDIYVGHWSSNLLMTEILSSLIAKGNRDLAALVIADRMGNWRWNHRFYHLIRSFPDPALREALLITAVRKLPKPERDSTPRREETDEHMAVIYSLWTLSGDIEISEEARNKAKRGLREAYAAEQSAAELGKSP